MNSFVKSCFHVQTLYFRNANNDKYNAYIFVFDLSEKDTFEELLQIIKLVTMNERSQQKSKRNTGAAAETLKIVVGNKKDLK